MIYEVGTNIEISNDNKNWLCGYILKIDRDFIEIEFDTGNTLDVHKDELDDLFVRKI